MYVTQRYICPQCCEVRTIYQFSKKPQGECDICIQREEVNSLVGTRVVKVQEYVLQPTEDDVGYKIYFDNGLILTAVDEEYGLDALQFVED